MKSSIAFLFVLVLVPFVLCHEGHSHSHDEETEDADVFVLTKDNFDSHIKENEFVFVEFYAPWCGHCKRLAPDWAKLATKAKTDGVKVSVAKLDATQAEEVAQKNGIRGYPTIKFFRNGNALDYEGGRTLDDMYAYIVRKSGPASNLLTTKDEVDSYPSKPKSKLLAYVDDEGLAEWLKAAGSGQLEDFEVSHVTDSSLFGDNKVNTLSIFKEGDDPVHYSGKWSSEDIVSHVKTEGYPLVEELAQKIWQRSSGSSTPLFAGFIDDAKEAGKTLIRELAKKFKGKVLFSQSNQVSLAERWGASGKITPTGILVNWVNQEPKMVIFNEELEQFNAETAEKFINDALAGSYQSYKKSEPIPATNDEPVKIVVGKNFEQLVKDPKKDVFVEFYAPWCGHCKKLAPVWDELAEAFADNENVVIAKMDGTANATPDGIDIKGYPTLLFFTADNKAGIPYNGERDLDSLIKFVEEKASHSVKAESGDGKVEL